MRTLIEFDALVSLFEEEMQNSGNPRHGGCGGMVVFECPEYVLSEIRKAARIAGNNVGWKPRVTYRHHDSTVIIWDDQIAPDGIWEQRARDIASSMWTAE